MIKSRFLKEINSANYNSIFEHPYLQVYKRLHERFNAKIQLNLFYQDADFNLLQMSDKYYKEWEENSNWLKLSFHSKMENVKPYEFSTYDEVYNDCYAVNVQIERFASPKALAKTTTVHYCLATHEGIDALKDNKVLGLLGLFGNEANPLTSYKISEQNASEIRLGKILKIGELFYSGIDIVLNNFSCQEILAKLQSLKNRKHINVMIHEQYFYSDYARYQKDFEEKLVLTLSFFKQNGYQSKFFEEKIY